LVLIENQKAIGVVKKIVGFVADQMYFARNFSRPILNFGRKFSGCKQTDRRYLHAILNCPQI
jgi:hypothetical protein